MRKEAFTNLPYNWETEVPECKPQPQIPQQTVTKHKMEKHWEQSSLFLCSFLDSFSTSVRNKAVRSMGLWFGFLLLYLLSLATHLVWACIKIYWNHFALLSRNNVGLPLISCWSLVRILCTVHWRGSVMLGCAAVSNVAIHSYVCIS